MIYYIPRQIQFINIQVVFSINIFERQYKWALERDRKNIYRKKIARIIARKKPEKFKSLETDIYLLT